LSREVRKTTAFSRLGIWRASFPSGTLSACLASLKRRSRPRPALFGGERWRTPVLILSCFVLFAQASALPVHIGLLLLPAHAEAMTHGCETGSCCTALCYLDKHGVHHCVHNPGDSCKCGKSTGDFETNPVFLSAIIILPQIDSLLPIFVPIQWNSPVHVLCGGREPSTPTPPPK